MRGPIDFLIVEFPGNNFKGEILRELSSAVEAGVIAVLDLSLISKDEAGNVTSMEVSEGGVFGELAGTMAPTNLISAEDVTEVAEVMDNNCSAGLLIIEQLWAKGLKQAIINAGGELVADGRIHPEASAQINARGR